MPTFCCMRRAFNAGQSKMWIDTRALCLVAVKHDGNHEQNCLHGG